MGSHNITRIIQYNTIVLELLKYYHINGYILYVSINVNIVCKGVYSVAVHK